MVLRGNAIAQRIKASLGITGLSLPRVHIDGVVWHLDVGSSHPGAVSRSPPHTQGLGCSPIKAVSGELGSERRETVRSLSGVGYLRGAALVREDRGGLAAGVSVRLPGLAE